MSPEKMRQRGIRIFREPPRRAILRNYRLCFRQVGYPPCEPCFANVEKSMGECVHGVLYALSAKDYLTLCRGESVGTFYKIEMVDVETYDGDTVKSVALFVCLPSKLSSPHESKYCPSLRYKTLICHGASVSNLAASYQEKLQQVPTCPDAGTFAKLCWKYRYTMHVSISRFCALHDGTFLSRFLHHADRLYSNLCAKILRRCYRTRMQSLSVWILIPGALFGILISTCTRHIS